MDEERYELMSDRRELTCEAEAEKQVAEAAEWDESCRSGRTLVVL